MREHRRLFAGLPPRWAQAWGEDPFGGFALARIAGVEVRLRWIRPGPFTMGSPAGELGRWADEGPQHRVSLPVGFWLGETAVTQALWQAVMGKNPSRFQGARRPVESVSWEDCQAFCAKVQAMLPDFAPRLPTEAEWEYACRAETEGATWTVPQLSREVDAPELDRLAWYSGNSGGETHPVGEKAPNPWGLRDMLGNVFEWCLDTGGDARAPGSLSAYTAADRSAPCAVADSPLRVIRGGSWISGARVVRAADRGAGPAGARFDNLGFRLAGGQESALQYQQATQASSGAASTREARDEPSGPNPRPR